MFENKRKLEELLVDSDASGAADSQRIKVSKAEEPGGLIDNMKDPVSWEKAEMLRDILADTVELEKLQTLYNQDPSLEAEKCVLEKRDSLNDRRDDFCDEFGPANCTSPEDRLQFCNQQLEIWKKWITNGFWWATDGFLTSLNDLPPELLEEILFQAGAIAQAELRL